MAALRYDMIKTWNSIAFKEDRHYLYIYLEGGGELIFNFLVNKSTDIAKHLKTIAINRFKEVRDEQEIKDQICLLRDAYDLPADYNIHFEQEFKAGPLVKVKRIEITNNRISWAGEAFELNRCIGITYSKKNSINGIKTSMEYQVHVYTSGEKNLLKSFLVKPLALVKSRLNYFIVTTWTHYLTF